MFAFGPGHQSLAVCERTEVDHKIHLFEDMEAKDSDERMSQTYTRPRDGKVFRLVSRDRGWD